MNNNKRLNKRPLIETHKELLSFLNTLKAIDRRKFVRILNKQQVSALAEVFDNFLKNNLTDDKNLINKLKKHQTYLRKIARRQTPFKQKIKILSSQRGGFLLGALLPIAASLIGSLFSK